MSGGGCLIASGLFSLIIYYWAVASRLPQHKIRTHW